MKPVQLDKSNTNKLVCPSRAELSNWLELGGGTSSDGISEHLESCDHCCNTLDCLTHSTVVEFYVRSVSKRPIGLSFLDPPQRAGDLGMLGRYAIERELNSGGMGIVFLARDMQLERHVAIKLMRIFDHAAAVDRFRREARAVAKLAHDHIVPIHSVAETSDGRPYLVMPLIAGESLRQRINRALISPREAAEWVRQIACGLHVAHEAGLIHRDVKPGNILLDSQDGRAKLTDFGLVHEFDGQSLTQTDGILGTPEFMSPEQIRNQALDGRSDVYSLGITLYQCLTGVAPFRGQTFEVLQQQQEQLPLAPSAIRPGIPRDLETICLKAIRKEPQARFESAQAFADDLDRFLRGEPIRARPVSFVERSRVRIQKHPWKTLSALLAMVVFLGIAISALLLARAYASEHRTSLALEHMRDEADQAFQLTRNQLTIIVNRLKQELLQMPQAEQAAVQAVRDVASLYVELNRLRPSDPQVAEEYLAALKEEWYAEWLYDGDSREQQALERFRRESFRLLNQFPASSGIASLRAELLLDLAIESENAGDRLQADQYQQQGIAMLARQTAIDSDSLAVRSLVWKAAWQAYQFAIQRDAAPEQIVELARNMVEAQQAVVERTPIDNRTEANCISIDQMSRLIVAQVKVDQVGDAKLTLERAAALFDSLPESSRESLEVRQAQVRILHAELELAKHTANLELQALKLDQLVSVNRSILQDFPDGEVQMKSLVQALCEHVEFCLEQGERGQLVENIGEIASLLNRIDSNPAVGAWVNPFREKLQRFRRELGE